MKNNSFSHYSKTLRESTHFSQKKHLGQVFLNDPNITEKIITACELKPEDTVLEIGPGLGVLTHRIAGRVKHLIAVETDPALAAQLSREFSGQPVEIIHEDFLQYDLSGLPGRIKAIGNLPYYITSPILVRILENRRHFTHLFCMVQLEFGRRLVAQPNTKDYSALTCFVQYYTEPRLLFKIKNTSFKPAPKVHSCFIRLDIRKSPLVAVKDEALLFTIIRQAFQQRRKTILNTISGVVNKEALLVVLESLKIDPRSRAENLRIEDFAGITNAIANL